VEKLIAGTAEGNPAVNGQTLEEEKLAYGEGEWLDAHNQPLKFHAEKAGVAFWDAKLYGGQQFERLLAEFRGVSAGLVLSAVSMDDVATAAGINRLNNVPNYARAACDVVAVRTEEMFRPLIEQMAQRAVYVLGRLTDLVKGMMEQKKKSSAWSEGAAHGAAGSAVSLVDSVELYPFFTYHVKELFTKFVDSTAKTCLSKCMDEFYGTRTIFWEYTEYADASLSIERAPNEEAKKAVEALATSLFERQKERITKNVLLKMYNHMLVPVQTQLWSFVQSRVSTLSNEDLTRIFDMESTKERLKKEEEALKKELQKLNDDEAKFHKCANQFSHPLFAADGTEKKPEKK